MANNLTTVAEYQAMLSKESALERGFLFSLATLGHDLPAGEPHYRFDPMRNWEYDYAWPLFKVAVELEGGAEGIPVRCHACGTNVHAVKADGSIGKEIRVAGYHAHRERFLTDMQKYRRGAILGWTILRYGHEDVHADPFAMIKEIRGELDKRRHTFTLIGSLTERESEILHYIAGGFVSADIADRLCISDSTVRRHAQSLCQKLNAKSRTAAVARASAYGLLDFERIAWADDPYLDDDE